MIKHKRKSKRKPTHKKILLDNTVQFERIKFPESVNQELNHLSKKYHFFTSNFTTHEFKVGLIFAAIEFYFHVDLYQDVSQAIMKWSDRFGRDPKYGLMLLGIQQLHQSIEPAKDVKTYLRRLEASILYLLATFDNQIQGKVGDFANDPVVKYEITDRDSYGNFSKIVKARKAMIPMASFWGENQNHLETLLSSTPLKTKYPKIYSKLEKIKEKFSNSDKVRVNRGIGDAVIAVDSPKEHIILTYDDSFSYLCPPLKKQHKKLIKK